MRVPLRIFILSSLLQASLLFAYPDSVRESASLDETISVTEITKDKVYLHSDGIHFESDDIYLDLSGGLLLRVEQLCIDKKGFFIPLFVGNGEPPLPLFCPKHGCYHPPPICQ